MQILIYATKLMQNTTKKVLKEHGLKDNRKNVNKVIKITKNILRAELEDTIEDAVIYLKQQK